MKIETYIDSLVSYAMNCGLAEPVDHVVLTNRLLEALRLDDYTPSQEELSEDLEQILAAILDDAVEDVEFMPKMIFQRLGAPEMFTGKWSVEKKGISCEVVINKKTGEKVEKADENVENKPEEKKNVAIDNDFIEEDNDKKLIVVIAIAILVIIATILGLLFGCEKQEEEPEPPKDDEIVVPVEKEDEDKKEDVVVDYDPNATPAGGNYINVGSGIIAEIVAFQAETFNGKTATYHNSVLRGYGIGKDAKNVEGAYYLLRFFLDINNYDEAGADIFVNKSIERYFKETYLPNYKKGKLNIEYMTNPLSIVGSPWTQASAGGWGEVFGPISPEEVETNLAARANIVENAAKKATEKLQGIMK
mgnify:CR=1 FL=1